MAISIRIKRGTGAAPASLLRGELAYYEDEQRLYIGEGDSGNNDANGLPIAQTVRELTTPATLLTGLQDVDLSGIDNGDVLVYDQANSKWLAQGPAFAPAAHKASHATGGTDALSPSDIGALASSLKGANNGVAELDSSGKLPTSQLPNLAVSDFLGEVANEAAMLALTGQKGDWASRTDSGAVWIITGDTPSSIGSWTQLSYPAAPVASVNGETGTVVLDHTDVGAAASGHTHSDATTSVAGFLSAADKTKLDGIASGAEVNVQSDWNASSGDAQILNKPSLATVATSGSYADLENIPSTFTPASHTHGNITNDGKIGSTAGLVVQTGASGAVTTLAAGTSGQVLKQGASGLEWGTAGGVGTVTSVTAGTGLTGGTFTDSGTIAVDFASTETAGKVVEANDARLSDTRTPTDNTVATAKLQDGAVTYAKIQDVSATDKILGRATAGAGDVEEITCTAAGRALLDDADAAAQRTTLGLGTAATSASTDFFAASAVSTFGASLIDDASAADARTTLGLGGASEKAVDFYAEASHTHGNITSAGAIGSTAGLPVKTGTSGVLEAGAFGTGSGEFCEGDDSRLSDARTPTAHNHTVTLEISGFIEVPEAKSYVLSPSIPTAITITNVKAKTGSGTCDIKLQDDGVDISDTTINDVGTSVSSPASEPSATVASGSVLTLVVSDLSSGAPEDLAFSVHYTVTSANNS